MSIATNVHQVGDCKYIVVKTDPTSYTNDVNMSSYIDVVAYAMVYRDEALAILDDTFTTLQASSDNNPFVIYDSEEAIFTANNIRLLYSNLVTDNHLHKLEISGELVYGYPNRSSKVRMAMILRMIRFHITKVIDLTYTINPLVVDSDIFYSRAKQGDSLQDKKDKVLQYELGLVQVQQILSARPVL